MPLLRRQPFHKQKPPPDLRADEDVFHCKLTNEVFRDYEEFFERIILCNSLVWSCRITGKSGLTYQEALDSEEKAKKNLSAFPNYLQRPILFLTTLTCRTRLVDLSEDIFSFAKDRYFIGEIVDVMVGTVRKSCRILNVVSTIQPKQPNGDVIVIDIDSDSDDDQKRSPTGKYGAPPETFQYIVQELKKSTTMTVQSSVISRKRTLYTREKSKLFLKHHTESGSGIFRVKEKVARQLNLHASRFEDFFAGSPPKFEKSEVKKKISPKRPLNNVPGTSLDGTSPKKRGRKKKEEKEKMKKSPKEQKTPEQQMREQFQHLSPAERVILKEKMKQEKMAEKMVKKEESRKKMEEERLKRKEEKAKEREKLREERIKEIEILREKNRPRDDMECDDLKVMPNFKPVQTRVPVDLFGDAIMILEFIHTFKSLFDFKQFFPKGFTWGMLESCLLDHDVDGPLCDLVQMLLVAIFTLQEEEAEEVEELDKEDQEMTARNVEAMEDDMTANHMIMMATMVASIPQTTHGMPLKKMLLDQFTLTEILRIHLASSGARASMKNARFRYQQRGGYTSLDDAGFEMRMQDPSLMKALASHSLFDLTPAEKLKVINTLLQQIMSYAATRDIIEESYERLRLLKYDLKQLQWAEQRREREDAQARYRQRQEEKQRERERKLQKMLEREQQLKAEEAGNGAVNGDANEPKAPQNKLLMLDEDRNTPSPDLDEDSLTEEEKARRRKKEEEDETRKKADFAKKEEDMINKILELQRTNAVYPIGRDRMYRRYWMFHALPGLYVEDHEVNVDPEVLDPFSTYLEKQNSIPLLTPVDEKNTSSDKENESLNMSANANTTENGTVLLAKDPRVEALKKDEDVIVISDSDSESRGASTKDGDMEVDESVHEDEPPPALDSLAAQQISNRKKVMWSFVDNEEVFKELIGSLNPRGFREFALRQSIEEIRTAVVKAIDRCPVDDLSLPPDAVEEARVKALALTRGISGKKAARGAVQNDTAQEAIELNLRDTLLDLEDRIYAGSLGYMKIKNRQAWREAIEAGSYASQTNDPVFSKHQKMEQAGDFLSESGSEEVVVKDLSRALLQIAKGLEHKYLSLPLGESEEAKKKRMKSEKDAADKKAKKKHDKGEHDDDDDEKEDSKQHKTTYEKWEEALLSVTNLSQVFLFLSTLDKSITWSKSALHARCRICRRKGDGEKMLLCDGCDRGHHMYCLKPPVEKVPTGDWYCPNCKPVEVKRSPRKDRRKTFSEEEEEEEKEDEDDEEEDSDEDSDEEVEEEEEEEDDENENLCVKCNKAGMLLCCDSCPGSYHLQCADPPLKKVPRGKWLCQVCLGVDKPGGKIKLIHKKRDSSKKKTTPGRSTPNSSRPSSRKGSPRDSPVPTKPRRSIPVSEEKPKLQKKSSTSRLSQDAYADMEGSPKHYVSSYRGSSKVQQMKHLEDIVNDLNKMDDAWPFLKPVSKKMVPDYYEVIDVPMDFSTIRNKINKFAYKKPADIIADVRQIFINCIEYNNRKTPEYKCGGNLSKLFESKIRNFEKDADESSPPPSKKSKK